MCSVRNVNLINTKTEFGIVTARDNWLISQILFRWIKNGGKEFSCTRADLAEYAMCDPQHVTVILRKYSALFYRRYVHTGRGENRRTYLHIDVNILELAVTFGRRIYDAVSRSLVKFLKEKMECVFSALARTFDSPKKTKEEEGKTIYSVAIAPSYIAKSHKMYNNFNTEGKNENLPSMSIDNEPLRIVTGEVLGPVSPMLMRNPPNNDTAYDESITECPDIYRDKALRRFINADKIDDMFQDFRYYKIKNKRSKKSKHSDWLRAWDNWVMNALKFNKDEFFDQERYHTQLQANGSKFQIPTSKKTSVLNTSFATEERIPWNKDLANESFWKIPGNPDNSQFTAFYTSLEKGGNIMDTKAGWLQRGMKWHERTRTEQSPSVKAYGESRSLEVILPDHLVDLHKKLIDRLEESNYIAWVQSPKVVIQEHANPSDEYLYSANYTACKNDFAKKTVIQRYGDDFTKLKIEII